MKTLVISWLLLMLGVNLNSGHYIYKVEKEDGPFYEVKSNPRGVVLVNTKLETPTLKDILFHGLIERIYGKEEPLITERAFTNSHGFPFLEELDDGSYGESRRLRNNLEDEEPEPKPLTDKAVKEAYKSRSYLFDQMRQRNDGISPDLLERKKRQTEIPYLPEALQIPSDSSDQGTYAPPKTYGMNLNPGGGYVWNNLNNPSSLYELGQSSSGYQNSGPYQLPASSETPQPEEITSSAAPEIIPSEEFTSAPETPDSDSSEDIYVNINKPEGQPLVNEDEKPIEPKEATPEEIDGSSTENPIANDAMEPTESTLEEAKPIEIPETPIETAQPDSQESKPVEGLEPAPVHENPEEPEELPAESSSTVPVEEIVLNTTEGLAENSAGDQVKGIPEAPTLPPLNYDSLPDYIRQAIFSTEKALIPEDVQATAQPVEDIPKTYGMNLTSGSGMVWNDLVNPPVSYEVGSPASNQTEETKETTTQAANIEEPVTGVVEQPAEPTNTEIPAIPEETAAPIDILEVTEQPKDPANEPEIKLPETEPENDENKATTEVVITSETPAESTESDVKLPATEVNNEDNNPSTELPELTITSETPEISKSTEPDVTLPGTENNEENNPITGLPEITSTTQILDTVAPVTEAATEEIYQNTDLPEIISTTAEAESIGDENKPNDGNVEPVVGVTPEPEDPEVDLSGETGDKVPELEEEKPDVIQKPDIMSELLKSEQFWKWLGEWTATYMELVEKHIRKIAIQEICNHAKQGIGMCPLDKPEDSGSITKDGKVTINGKEIDLNENFNQPKRGTANKGNRVDATTIYGNSVGNDKVTNVFIFNPNNAKDIIEGLRPENDKVNIVIEDQNKEIKGKSDEIAEPITEIPEVDENEEITEDAGIEDREVEIPKVEIEAVAEVKPIGDTVENEDEIITEDVKEVENVTENVELRGDTAQVAGVTEVTTVSSDLGNENEKEAPAKP